MAYYTAFINAWNTSSSGGGLPASTTGTSLVGLTTANKLAAINAWSFTGAVPGTIYVTGAQIANCINWTEFAALTATQQSNLLQMFGIQGPLLGGSANTSHLLAGMILAYFTNLAGPTIAALTALSQATVQPWWQSAGYPRAFDLGDCTAAGVS